MTTQSRNTKQIWVRIRDLKLHPTAQRLASNAKVAKLTRTFKKEAVGSLQAVDYVIGGVPGPWVIDGQHRLLTMLELGMHDSFVPVDVHFNVTTDAEASELFLLLNDRTLVAAYDKFLNGVKSGDPIWVGVANEIKLTGLKTKRGGGKAGSIACVHECYALWQFDQGATLRRTLNISLAAWGYTGEAVEGKLLFGIGKALMVYGDEIDDDVLQKKLSKYPGGAGGILGDAKGRKRSRPSSSFTDCVKDVVLDVYNSRRRRKL